MAQKIPDEFDGIVAGAPAINWDKFMIQEAWGYAMASTYVKYLFFNQICFIRNTYS